MLKLTPTPTEPTWLDLLPGVRVRLKPPTVLTILAARDAATEVYRADLLKDAADRDPDVIVHATIAMVTSYARRRIEGWEGVGDDAGEAIPVTPENVDAAMDLHPFYEAFDRLVLAPAMAA
ncbi:hypothetical protein [Methylobacterium flocculans]|uniref:hypothetical protein n=1 Tax=Methylobacterium flocculans TaxID=2984843 RepID=UPI0021F2924A|nr:hypothetical protein [Methylobacterium sp. FF17]